MINRDKILRVLEIILLPFMLITGVQIMRIFAQFLTVMSVEIWLKDILVIFFSMVTVVLIIAFYDNLVKDDEE